MRNFFLIIALVAAFFVAREGVQRGLGWLRMAKMSKSEIATRDWTDRVIMARDVVVDLPFPLKRERLALPPETKEVVASSTHRTATSGDFVVAATTIAYKPGTPIDLDGAAEGAVSSISSNPDVGEIKSKTHEALILGKRAVEVESRIENEDSPLDFHSLIFRRGSNMFQLMLIAPADQEGSDETWHRMRDSIRLKTDEDGTESGGTIVPGDIPMPDGMERGVEVQEPKSGDEVPEED